MSKHRKVMMVIILQLPAAPAAAAAAAAAARCGNVGVGGGGGGGGGGGVNTHGHKASGRQVRRHTMLDTPPPSLDSRPRLAPPPFLSEMSGFALSPPPRLGKKDSGSSAEFRNLMPQAHGSLLRHGS